MGLSGTLGDFNPIEIIAIFDLLEKSGKLLLTRGDEEGLVVFRRGRIIYASSSGFRESLGSMLLARGLVREDELVDALGRQAYHHGVPDQGARRGGEMPVLLRADREGRSARERTRA